MLFTPLGAEAQTSSRVARVGVLAGVAPSRPHPLTEALQALGWVEGQNIVFEWRSTEGNVERATPLAAELVRLKVDVIVATAPPNVRAVQKATSSIPIVMLAVTDPVGMGFVASLSQPGGNITGVSSAVPGGMMGKTLELIKEAVPATARVGLLFNAANPLNYATAHSHEITAAGQALKLELHQLAIRNPEEIETTMTAANLSRVDAVFVIGDPLTFRHRDRIHTLAIQHGVPTVVPTPEYVEGKALLAYGPSLLALLRQGAVYVDKILKGRKPAELPVEQPREFQLVVNQRTARILGITLPPALLLRADQIIE
jgi:putative ABC transport system substrate-binding protein